MKLPWDQKYIKISFHVIFTLSILYCLVIIVQNIVDIAIFFGLILDRVITLLSPFIIALVIAYLLDPMVDWFNNILFHKKNKSPDHGDFQKRSRGLAALCTYLSIIFCLVLASIWISFSIGNQLSVKNFDHTIATTTAYLNNFNEMIGSIQQRLMDFGFSEQLDHMITNVTQEATSFIETIGMSIIGFISKAGGHILNFVLSLVISFYLLKDKEFFLRILNQILHALISEKYVNKFHFIWKDIDHVLSGYIRGQLIDALIMGTLITITLSIIGIDFPLIIGFIAGIANLIPYFGPIVAVIAASLMGFISDNPMKALYSLIALSTLQQIDGSIIVPKVVGESVDLHPIFVLLSIVVAGSLFGILGMLLAVPGAALLKLFAKRYIEHKIRIKEIRKG